MISFRFGPFLLLGMLLGACTQSLPQLPSAKTDGSVMPEDADAATFVRMGDRLLRQGDVKSATTMYSRAQRIDPGDATVYARLGDVAWQRGQLNAAAGLYAEALRIDQTNPDALLGRARALALADEADAAMVLVNDLIQSHGPEYRALSLKAMLFDLNGDHDAAQTLFSRALDDRGNDPNLIVSLAYSYALEGDYRTAVDKLRPLGQNQATAPRGQYALADVYALSGQSDVGLELRKAAAGGADVSGADQVFLSRLAGLTPPQQARALYFRSLPTLEQQEQAGAPEAAKTLEAPEQPSPAVIAETKPPEDLRPKKPLEATYWVQIASFKSFEALEMGWYNISRQNPELSSRLMPRVESLDIADKGRFHRLYAGGYATKEDADQTCRALRNVELSCVIVVGARNVESLAQRLADR